MKNLSIVLITSLIIVGNLNPVFCQVTPKNVNTTIGKFIYQDGSVYVGDLINGMPEGQGTVEYANGNRYTGGWKDNVPHGEGEFYWAEKQQYGKALWNLGKRVALLPLEANNEVATPFGMTCPCCFILN